MELFNKLSRWRARRRKLVRLKHAVLALPEPDRSVYLLCATARLPYGTVAERLGLTVPEVERHLARALCTLAAAMVDTADPAVALDPTSR